MEDRRGLGFVVGMNLVCCKEQNWRSDGRMVGEKVREVMGARSWILVLTFSEIQ